MFTLVWWAVLIVVILYLIYYERIIFAQEEFLRERFGDVYIKWAENTPVFLPNPRKYQKPNLPFSLRKVLRRGYSSIFAIIASFTFLEITGDLLAEGRLEIDLGWALFFSIGLLEYLILMTLKKKTRVLHVEGR